MRLAPALASLAFAVAVPGPAAAIVGGAEASPAGSGLVMVLNARGGFCSGVVLAPTIVLTAAHCVAGAQDVRLHWRDEAGAPVFAAPRAVSVHPGYVANAIASRRASIDMALVRAAEPLPSRFGAATLASGAAPGNGSEVEIGGYGVVDPRDPRSSGTFRTASLRVAEPYGPSRILLWAAAPRGRTAGGCEGDSGGALSNGAGNVVAVTSWAKGSGAAGCGAMTQGVLVAPQRGWIDRVLSEWGAASPWR